MHQELSQLEADQKWQDEDEGSTDPDDSVHTLPLINSRMLQLTDVYQKALVPCKASAVAVPSAAMKRTSEETAHSRHATSEAAAN